MALLVDKTYQFKVDFKACLKRYDVIIFLHLKL